MPYVSIGTDKKKEVVKRYWTGESITSISKRFHISRDSVHTWSNMADEAITSILEQRSNQNRIKKLENENKELKGKLEKLQKEYLELSQSISVFKEIEFLVWIYQKPGERGSHF